MKRTTDEAFFECPVCGKKPYVNTYNVNVGWASCKGYGIHRHKEVSVFVPYARPSELYKKISEKWNQMQFVQARFLFDENGNPFEKEGN